MTKSRTARAPFLVLAPAFLLSPAPARAQEEARAAWEPPVPATTEAVLAAYQARIDTIVRRGCARGADDDILVCGRGGGGAMRVPYEPEAGHIARALGEAPSGRDALSADRCLRLCYQPVGVDIEAAIRAINRGLGRLLHPD